MKHITLIILAFVITAVGYAKCANSGIYCLSKSSTINKNGLIILEFYALSQKLISELNKKYPIYLKSPNSQVQLNIIETLKGEMRVTQIILKPVSELKVNETYTLLIDNLPKYERNPERYNDSTNKREQLTFRIKNHVDNDFPTFNCTPTELKKTLAYFGCGPASSVYFTISGQDKSELFVRTTVINKSTGTSTSYILRIESGYVKVGHGMCSGPFHFDNGDNFEVSFKLFDQSGNESSMTSLIAFTKPTKETYDW